MSTRTSALQVWAAACLLIAACGRTLSAAEAGVAAEPSQSDPVARAEGVFAVEVQVHASERRGALNPIWRFFGADEPNYAYMPHGLKLMGQLGDLRPKQVYFRAHNLLTSGDGQPALKWGSTGVYEEDSAGNAIYNWTILDRIFDAYLSGGVRPYVEIGFMPQALSIRPEPYRHHWTPQARYEEIYTGWAYPPKDYAKWGKLVYEWARHCIQRYSAAEVEQWFWQVWNEPNIGYWRGSPEEFLKLHDYAIDAVRRALPTARVGGADTAGSGGRFTRQFLEHCLRGTNYATGRVGTPLDFVSFHAKGAPVYTNGHVRMGIAQHLRTIQEGFRIIASYPELRGKPVVIGESDPEGCAACQGPALAYRNGTMYSSYTAASFARKLDLADAAGITLAGALTWAFEFENQPFFAGFRSLASNGIDKPVLNVFRMFAQMTGERVRVASDSETPLEGLLKAGVRGRPDVSGLASVDRNTLFVLLWHYHDDDVPRPEAQVKLRIDGLPASATTASARQYRVDDTYSNAYTAWKSMGAPQQPTAEQYAAIEGAGQLHEFPRPNDVAVEGGKATLQIALPRRAVSLLRLKW